MEQKVPRARMKLTDIFLPKTNALFSDRNRIRQPEKAIRSGALEEAGHFILGGTNNG
ncbi:hypothetical protein LCGC14_1183040 [marine sediment metagenome]|uniref:Uncharacterized protein n=1 Tax=marine sediment metagenome TaxID=412755 RepID=A0A0F9LRC5_9ZZZZ